ncbi:putative NADPH-quinone reductase (modulator of drug activity B) [Hoeflea sp. IMCC20628]|uniref:NAD(P)H-dependent oxidoreductase n=1 Tax=Hoeflea sp. IMCC20628 TaxID=1620421 RepID=UPI00063AC8B7|nr:NAD(P)H-dependent oxidoreductase [Hoeflea sp. IMCC20628]AKI00661.1 putative NADPH-quinone reductase (modulator of drug activity B) [Hoeflea sp. IMCC20628]
MRILVVHAHPVASSFNAGLFRMTVEQLPKAGHEVDVIDLYQDGFNPVMSEAERLNYHDLDANRKPVEAYVDRLLKAEALVLVYPVWNYGFPAILKGWFDRVFLPGVSFGLVNGKVQPTLRNIGKIVVVTSYGGSRFRSWLMGDPPRKIANRMLRATVRPGASVSYLAHYEMNLSTDKTRHAFMARVQTALDKL